MLTSPAPRPEDVSAARRKGNTSIPCDDQGFCAPAVRGAHVTAFAYSQSKRIRSMANSVPTLTGLATPVTFLENTVNATPQIIDADVTFTDADNNFDSWSADGHRTAGARTRWRSATRAPARARSASRAATSPSAAASSAASRRRRQHAHRHLQRQCHGGGDRGADREPDLRQFLGHADREPQPRAQGHRRRRLRRHRTARVYAADRRRQPAQRRRCWELQRGQLRRPRRRRRSRRRRRGRPRPSRLFPEHRHRHRAGLRRADRRRQSVQRRRFSVSQHAQLRRPRR